MDAPTPDALAAHHVRVKSDNVFQRRARLMQALWRERQALPIGLHRGAPLGSRLAMPWAEETLGNSLTDTVRRVVRREVVDAPPGQGQLYGRPRIFADLLSSQPLCFNLFGELAEDLPLASRVFARLMPGRVERVESVGFEYSPGRGDARYTGDKSAFDVFVRFAGPTGPGFVGVEVKYHEALGDAAARHRPRYEALAAAMGCFRAESRDALRAKPLQQIWRDHLLAGAMLEVDDWADGCFVFLYPRENTRCAKAVHAYRGCLRDERTFAEWTLEDVVAALRAETDARWVEAVWERYLDFSRLG